MESLVHISRKHFELAQAESGTRLFNTPASTDEVILDGIRAEIFDAGFLDRPLTMMEHMSGVSAVAFAMHPTIIIYNGPAGLRFTRDALRSLFDGSESSGGLLTHWNDTRLGDSNGGVALPDGVEVEVLSLLDCSGESHRPFAVLSEYVGLNATQVPRGAPRLRLFEDYGALVLALLATPGALAVVPHSVLLDPRFEVVFRASEVSYGWVEAAVPMAGSNHSAFLFPDLANFHHSFHIDVPVDLMTLAVDFVGVHSHHAYPLISPVYAVYKRDYQGQGEASCARYEEALAFLFEVPTLPELQEELLEFGFVAVSPGFLRLGLSRAAAEARCAGQPLVSLPYPLLGAGAAGNALINAQGEAFRRTSATDELTVLTLDYHDAGEAHQLLVNGETLFAAALAFEHDDHGGRVQLPWAATGLVVVADLGVPQVIDQSQQPLVLDLPTLRAIYHGEVRNWSDPALVALNPVLAQLTADLEIAVVHYLGHASHNYILQSALGMANSSLNWHLHHPPVHVLPAHTEGAAMAHVRETPGALAVVTYQGYLAHARSNVLPFSLVHPLPSSSDVISFGQDSLDAAVEAYEAHLLVHNEDNHHSLSPDLHLVAMQTLGAYPLACFTLAIMETEVWKAGNGSAGGGSGGHGGHLQQRALGAAKMDMGSNASTTLLISELGLITESDVMHTLYFVHWLLHDPASSSAMRSIISRPPGPELTARTRRTLLSFLGLDNQTRLYPAAACVNFDTGELCSSHGDCHFDSAGELMDAHCECVDGFQGLLCQVAPATGSSGDGGGGGDTARSLALALGVALPVLLVLAVLCVLLLACSMTCALVLIVAVVVVAALVLVLVAVALGAGSTVLAARRIRRSKRALTLVAPEEVEVHELIGRGAFSSVHRATWRSTEVAVKIPDHGVGNADTRAFLEELDLMTELRHPNVVMLMAAVVQPPLVILIMEYMELGSVYDVLHHNAAGGVFADSDAMPTTVLPESLRLAMALRAARGMAFLADCGVVHRDLKSLNLLVDSQFNVKVSDFGLAMLKRGGNAGSDGGGDDRHTTPVGTLLWMAPEILCGTGDYTEKSDIFSFGIILWELLTCKDPYDGMAPAAVARGVVWEGMRPKIPETAPVDLKLLIEDCWDTDIDVRPDFAEVLRRLSEIVPESASFATGGGGSSSSGVLSSRFSSSSATLTNGRPIFAHRSGQQLLPHLPSATSSGGSSTMSSRRVRTFGDSKASGSFVPLAPPTGAGTTFAFLDVSNGEELWTSDDVGRTALAFESLDSLIKRATQSCRARLAEMEPFGGHGSDGCYLVVLDTPPIALHFISCIRQGLAAAAAAAAADDNKDGGGDDEAALAAHRALAAVALRCALHLGKPRAVEAPSGHRVTYTGEVVDKTAVLCAHAAPMQVLASREFYLAAQANDNQLAADFKLFGRWKLDFDAAAAVPPGNPPEQIFVLPSFGMAAETTAVDNDEKGKKKKKKKRKSKDKSSDSDIREQLSMTQLMSSNKAPFLLPEGLTFGDVSTFSHSLTRLDEGAMLALRRDAARALQHRHNNCAQFLGLALEQGEARLVWRRVDGKPVKETLRKKGQSERVALLLDVARALHFLEVHDMLRIKLEPARLRVDEFNEVFVTDYGFEALEAKKHLATLAQSLDVYVAPEALIGEARPSEPTVVVYAFGMLLYELVTGHVPVISGKTMMEALENVLEGERPVIPKKMPSDIERIVKRCWHKKPKKRPSLKIIVESLSELE